MKCEQCGCEVLLKRAWIIDAPDRNKVLLCSEWCTRTWIGPDRPLSRRVTEAETGMPTPQHMVVDTSDTSRRAGENGEDFLKRQWARQHSERR